MRYISWNLFRLSEEEITKVIYKMIIQIVQAIPSDLFQKVFIFELQIFYDAQWSGCEH